MKIPFKIYDVKVAKDRFHREWNATSLQLFSDCCDLVMPTASLGLLELDEGIVGLAGTVSSLLGVYSVWKKTA
jgi:peroxin-11B